MIFVLLSAANMSVEELFGLLLLLPLPEENAGWISQVVVSLGQIVSLTQQEGRVSCCWRTACQQPHDLKVAGAVFSYDEAASVSQEVASVTAFISRESLVGEIEIEKQMCSIDYRINDGIVRYVGRQLVPLLSCGVPACTALGKEHRGWVTVRWAINVCAFCKWMDVT